MLPAGLIVGMLALYGAIDLAHKVKGTPHAVACKLHLKKCPKPKPSDSQKP